MLYFIVLIVLVLIFMYICMQISDKANYISNVRKMPSLDEWQYNFCIMQLKGGRESPENQKIAYRSVIRRKNKHDIYKIYKDLQNSKKDLQNREMDDSEIIEYIEIVKNIYIEKYNEDIETYIKPTFFEIIFNKVDFLE